MGEIHFRLAGHRAKMLVCLLTMRVKKVLKTQQAQLVAKNIAKRFRKACQQVYDRSGAAADN